MPVMEPEARAGPGCPGLLAGGIRLFRPGFAAVPLACLLVALLTSLTPAAATDLSGTVAADATLTKALSPYHLTGSLTINSGVTLTVEPGVEVFPDGLYRIYVFGRLVANGTSSSRVYFRVADLAARGVWEGLYVAGGAECTLNYTTVRAATTGITCPGGRLTLNNCYVNYAQEDGVLAWNASDVQATSTQFDHAGRRGLCVEGVDVTGSVSNCRFYDNAEYPAYLKATAAEMLKDGNTYLRNGRQAVGVSGSAGTDITDGDTWTRQAVPFDLDAGAGDHVIVIAAGGALTINAGLTTRGGGFDVSGSLTTRGASGTMCQMTSSATVPAAGDWPGLTFRPGGVGKLSYLNLAYADTGVTADGAQVEAYDSQIGQCRYDGVRVTGGSLLIVGRCTVASHGRDGVRLENVNASTRVSNCQLKTNGRYPLWTQAEYVKLLQYANTFAGNVHQAIGVNCGNTPDLSSGTHTWPLQSVPLDLTAGSLGGTFNVGPGATLNLTAGQTFYAAGLNIEGYLYASGTSHNPLVFLPATAVPQPGDWTGIVFNGGRGWLRGARVEYAQNGVTITANGPEIREVVARYSQYDGLRCLGTCSSTVVDSQLRDNGRYGVYVAATANPSLGVTSDATPTNDGRNTLRDNGTFDVYNLAPSTISAVNNNWGTTTDAMIAAHIYDKSDNAAVGVVKYAPFWPTSPNTAPVLRWLSSTGYGTDGVDPNSGAANATFRFRVVYADANGQPPTAALLYVQVAGAPLAGSPFALDRATTEKPDYVAGVTYFKNLTLPAGTPYTYRFSASDGQAAATGSPTTAQSGLVVGTSSLLAASLLAAQTPAGQAEIRWTLSTAATVTVRVCNLAGRQVALVLDQAAQAAGPGLALWSGRTVSGVTAPPGRYFVAAEFHTAAGQRQTLLQPLNWGR